MVIDDLNEKYENIKKKAIEEDMIDISRKYAKSKKETTKAKYQKEIKNLETLSRRLPYEVLVNMYGFPEKIYGPFPNFDCEEYIGGYIIYHTAHKEVDDKILKLIQKI